MALKPEISLGVGLATATVVYGIYMNALPPVVDLRATPANDDQVASTEKAAAWTAAAVVAGISLIAKDATVFIIGGAMIVALSWWNKHANMVNPEFGLAVPKADMLPEQFDDSQMSNAENYDYSETY
jgi:hypothetical protein